jgi:hypothetical protein
MPKSKPVQSLHEPLSGILGTQAKLAVLRVLSRAGTPLAHREVSRRAGMAYRSIDLALSDLLAAGVVGELEGGRERRVELRSGHRLAPVISALLRAESDFFPSLRAELKAVASGGDNAGLISLSLVGPVALRKEQLGDPIELVLVASDGVAAARWKRRLEVAGESIALRFGVACQVICYEVGEARKLWQSRTPKAEAMVREAEPLAGDPLVRILEGIA